MPRTQAHVTPEVLRWARESAGYDIAGAAKKIGVAREKLERAEQGSELLTLRQAEKAADAYDRPLAALFLPDTPMEESVEAQFRRLPDAPEPPWPPELILVNRQVRERLEAAAELYAMLDEEPAWPRFVADVAAADWDELAAVVRARLQITLDEQEGWRDARGYTPLRNWTDAVERIGVLVMQIGDVSLEVMRGFASPSDSVPAIVINTQDDARARAFSVVHELGHLLLVARGEHEGSQEELEQRCNDFAGEVMMPGKAFRQCVTVAAGGRHTLAMADELGLIFGVTPRAAAIRARRLELISRAELSDILKRVDARTASAAQSVGGGNYYWTRIARLGPSFVRLVLAALDSQALTYPHASSLLGVKANNFGTLRDYMTRRAAST